MPADIQVYKGLGLISSQLETMRVLSMLFPLMLLLLRLSPLLLFADQSWNFESPV